MAATLGLPVFNSWEHSDLVDGGRAEYQDELLLQEDFLDSLLCFEDFDEMTKNYPVQLPSGSDQRAFLSDSSPSQLSWTVQAPSASDVAKSPGDNSQHHTSDRSPAGNSSQSPGDSSQVLTPASTLPDYNTAASGDDPERLQQSAISFEGTDNLLSSPYIDPSVSPISAARSDDYVLVRDPRAANGSASIAVGRPIPMNNPSNQPPPRTSSPGESGYSAGTVSAARTSSTTGFANAQWGSLTSTTNRWMEGDASGGHSDPLDMNSNYVYDSGAYTSQPTFSSPGLAGYNPFETFENVASPFNNLPFRSADNGNQPFLHAHYVPGSPFNQNYPPAQQYPNQPQMYLRPPQSQLLNSQRSSMENMPAADSHIPSTSSLLVERPSTLTTAPSTLTPRYSPRPQGHYPSSTRRQQASNPSSARASPYPLPPSPIASSQQQLQQQQYQQPQQQQQHHLLQSGGVSPVKQEVAVRPSNRQFPPLAAAEASIVPDPPTQPPPSRPEPSRGGRKKGSNLAEAARAQSHKMRGVKACWRCALQRDPCDDGEPCGRCLMKTQRGQPSYFPCDRTKLIEFVHEFLPPSMTLMHQKQTIEDTVTDQVLQWDVDHPIDIYLTAGYGEPMCWTLYEFKPKTRDLLGQLQYNQSKACEKYSPPFALMKLDATDDNHFAEHLEVLMQRQYLEEFGDSCFAEENIIDPRGFQARMLDLMCHLYLNTEDKMTHEILREVLRMMIITYIMGHTLCIVQETLPSVLTSVRHSPQYHQSLPHTSPRLANRQLKFYFSTLRNSIYTKVLKWQQHVLRTAGKNNATWLPVFCAMLGFAMVLEEVQITIQIQADAKIRRKEMGYEAAHNEAKNACERIDNRFKLLIGLFQCKYRDRKWGVGSFGNQTPVQEDPLAREFLGKLHNLVLERRDHLANRKDVEFLPESQCFYTSRLVARFLLPFLDLPAS